jgi:uncharacterized protein (TIGR02594 family)
MKIAREKLGIHEIPGPRANAFIVECLKSTTLDRISALSDETPWCSAFVNRIMQLAGYKGTKSAWARSWLAWGREPEDSEFGEGVIVVLERGKNFGHVGFLIDWEPGLVKLLGGNQGDAVTEAWFPESRVIGWRVPK